MRRQKAATTCAVRRYATLLVRENNNYFCGFVVIGSASTTSVGCVWTTGAATTPPLEVTLSKSLLVSGPWMSCLWSVYYVSVGCGADTQCALSSLISVRSRGVVVRLCVCVKEKETR